MKITILTSGTRGDVQPYIALGRGLQQAGYDVGLATHPAFRRLIESYNLELVPVEGNPNELLAQYPAALTLDRNPLHNLQATWRYLRAVRPHFERMLDTAWTACRDSDALLVTLPTTWGQSIAERLQIPCTWALVQPLSRSRAYPTVFQPWNWSLGPRYNDLTHRTLEQLLWQPWRVAINRWRRHTLGLLPLPFGGPFDQVYATQTPFVYGFSPHVVPCPTDWPRSHTITGYWFLDHPAEWQPPADLQRFLVAGSPPVAITFGSMGQRRARHLLPVVLDALRRTGQRAVLIVDQQERVDLSLPLSVYAVDAVPHDWLFERCAAVVHHGGAGTTAASLRAGVPTVVVPFAVDQRFWGVRVAALGVGSDPVPARSLTAGRLALALNHVLGDRELCRRADRLGRQLRAEDGVGAAVTLIGNLVG